MTIKHKRRTYKCRKCRNLKKSDACRSICIRKSAKKKTPIHQTNICLQPQNDLDVEDSIQIEKKNTPTHQTNICIQSKKIQNNLDEEDSIQIEKKNTPTHQTNICIQSKKIQNNLDEEDLFERKLQKISNVIFNNSNLNNLLKTFDDMTTKSDWDEIKNY